MRFRVSAHRAKGFTLIEMMVVMAIMGTIAALSAPHLMNELNLLRAKSSAEETQMIVDAARVYRMKTSTWPGNGTCADGMSTLQSQGMIAGIPAFNRYESPYSTSCTQYTFSVDQNVTEDWDGYMANALAGTQIVNTASHQIRTTIGIPGSEPALEAKLSRIATGNAELNRMRTTLLLGGNDITEVNRLEAVTGQFSGNVNAAAANIAGAVSAGTVNASGGITGGSVTSNSSVNGVTGNFSGGVNATTGTFNDSVSAPQASFSNNTTTRTLTVQEAASITGTFWSQGTSQFTGVATFADAVVLNKIVSNGQGGCVTGSIARDGSGKTMSCQNGVWKPLGGGTPEVMTVTIPGHIGGDVTTYTCPAGYIKTGWDTSGQRWTNGGSGAAIGVNDYATVFCTKYQ
ncbi:prepilin-type N-terminal cleavage/methylation domain-containing protein [Pseudomonas syringae]|nr:prepilin-type N-terminal cleavage/methylation domain-containing protein [Pseudomonas syringae]MCF5423526.1 prepilin-type N-terminal cleavage/methylation domain-containing protein [Pseudomonas syringae]MCF5455210.1 prepilin-type N-terminal cleavage/methylation domain-containing protein [Pseudomonas syringae]MCF5460418.1 prepilin-type N-terminal cleavage/methylation domain-containing protein [Pseudomonas syringae]